VADPSPRVFQPRGRATVGLHHAEAHLAIAIGRGAEADGVDCAPPDGQLRLVELHVPSGAARLAHAQHSRAAFDRRIDRRALVLLDVPALLDVVVRSCQWTMSSHVKQWHTTVTTQFTGP
jgi:hypothetical protein